MYFHGQTGPMVIWLHIPEEEESCGSYAMKRVAPRPHLPSPWLFEPAKQTISPTTACAAVPSLSANTRYLISVLSGLGRALGANFGESSAQ